MVTLLVSSNQFNINMSEVLRGYQKAKEQALYGRCSVGDLRIALKKEFTSRLRSERSKQVDLHRNIFVKRGSSTLKAQLLEIEENLLADREAMTSLDANTFLKLLTDIEEELLQEELELRGQLYERDVNREVNSIIDNLLNVCLICDKFTNLPTSICHACAQECFNDD